mgnify:CR=1 FL=1
MLFPCRGRSQLSAHGCQRFSRLQGRPLAGILLFTDGNATDLQTGKEIPGLPPVYPVVIGSEKPVRDLALQQLRATQTDFEDAPISAQARPVL